jgi:drug/metabolite transporter (DMT)-like permease
MAALAFIWGSSFILMKRGLMVFDPGQVASIRMFVSFLCLLPFIFRRIPEIKKEHWKFLIASGLLGNGIPAFLFATAQMQVPSAMAGMLNSLTPVFTLVIGLLVFHTDVSYSKVLGVFIGLAGASSLIWFSNGSHWSGASWMALLIVAATVMYACSVNIIKHKLAEIDSMLLSGCALVAVGPPTGIYLFCTDFTTKMTTVSGAWSALGYVMTLGIFGTAISLVLFNKLIKLSGALFASSVTYLIPIVALAWGFVDGEPIKWYHVLALTAILTGVYLINYRKPETR